MTRRRIALFTVGALALTPFLLLGLVWLVLASEAGSAWLLRQADQRLAPLSVEGIDGSVLHGLRLQRLAWDQGGTAVTLQSTRLALDFSELLLSRISLDALAIEEVSITFAPAAEATAQTDEGLPRLALPPALALTVESLQLQRLAIGAGQPTVLENIRGALSWTDTRLSIDGGQLGLDATLISASGRIDFHRQWPLALTVSAQDPRLPGTISGRVSGSLQQLSVQGKLQGPYPLTFDGSLQPLAAGLPLQARASLADSVPLPAGGAVVASAQLQLEGSLADLQGEAQAAIEQLLPQPLQLHSRLRWHQDVLTLSGLSLASAGNRIGADCRGALQPAAHIDCEGELAVPAGGELLAALESLAVSGPFTLRADTGDQQPLLRFQTPGLEGRYREQPLTAQLELSTTEGESWQLHSLALAAGDNRLRGSGRVGPQSDLQLQLEAGALSVLPLELSGRLTADIDVRGDLKAPNIGLAAQAPELAFRQYAVTELRLQAQFDRLLAADSRLQLSTASTSVGDAELGQLQITLQGTRTQPQLELALEHPAGHRMELACDADSDAQYSRLQAKCERLRGHANLAEQRIDFRQRQALAVRWQRDANQLHIEPWCLRAAPAALCLEQAVAFQDGQLDAVTLSLSELPVRWSQPWMPERLTLTGDARASAQIQLTSLQPFAASAEAEIPALAWRWSVGDEPLHTGFEDLRATLDLTQERAQLDVSLAAQDGGSGELRLAVDDPQGTRGLDGRVLVRQLQLTPFAIVSDAITELGGTLNADIGLSGTTADPGFSGDLSWQEGVVDLAMLAYPVNAIEVEAELGPEALAFEGDFHYGDGTGALQGQLYWPEPDSPWQLQAAVRGDALPVQPLPDSSLAISPQLQVALTPAELEVHGRVAIDRARIVLEQLPPETISPSPDARVIGAGREREDEAFELDTDVAVNLGPDFQFKGFGAELTLSGGLQVSQNELGELQAQGEVEIEEGRYRAYGQRLLIESGSLLFTGPLDNPDVNITAVRELPDAADVVAGLRIDGPLQSPSATLFSEPPLPESEIAHYILTGRASGELGEGGGGYETTLLSLGLARGGAEQAQELAEKFGIKDLEIGTVSGAGGTQADIRGRLSDDLTVRYTTNVSEESSAIIFRYQLSEHLAVELMRGVEDTLDLFYSFSID